MPLEQRTPAAVAQLCGALGRVHDVGEEHGGEHAVADGRASHAGQELLDLMDGPAIRGDLDVLRIRDVICGVTRVTRIDEGVVRSAQHQRRTLHAGKRVTHVELADHDQRCGGGIGSH